MLLPTAFTFFALLAGFQHINIGIKHDFPFINICYVLRGVLKTKDIAQGF